MKSERNRIKNTKALDRYAQNTQCDNKVKLWNCGADPQPTAHGEEVANVSVNV